eukprot:TRINITY_DN2176_c0_g1_i2.p1 TRINITY_DN2176_c0_g1~~TRINITY_DN2176_c0_g1_i2.p1  ORF type:complete len:136 (+),score=41.74 TRINITY_DN2176_c0_g1_i2:69-476(+)
MSGTHVLFDSGVTIPPQSKGLTLRKSFFIVSGLFFFAAAIVVSIALFSAPAGELATAERVDDQKLGGLFAPPPTLATVAKVDISKFAGLWYEIATNYEKQEKDCFCTTAEYTIQGPNDLRAVSYTHLTLPTIYSV